MHVSTDKNKILVNNNNLADDHFIGPDLKHSNFHTKVTIFIIKPPKLVIKAIKKIRNIC